MNLRSRKGMTLVELIVVVAFTAVIIGAACAVLYLGMHSFHGGTSDAFSQQKTTLAESYLQRYAATASGVSTAADGTANGVIFSISNNTLSIKKQTVTGGTSSQADIAEIDGISKISFSITNGSLNYTIYAADDSYKLNGGIVLNNSPGAVLSSYDVPGSGSTLFFKTAG